MHASGWLENVGNDCRYAARRLRQSPGFAAAAILTLALGIGANVAVFTVVQAVLLSSLPYPHPERLVRIYDDLRGSNSRDVGISAPELWDLRDGSDVFENISGSLLLTRFLQTLLFRHQAHRSVDVWDTDDTLGRRRAIGELHSSAESEPDRSARCTAP